MSAGEAVTFVAIHTGQVVHECTLGDAAMQQGHADEMAPNGPSTSTLQIGEPKQLAWRFGETGTPDYGCHEPGHLQAAMPGLITT
ncbi:MAG TPA: hypothetical protein VGR16_06005, partial [Thermomicrobiales bacterium]|nr:hypothetical protein [Thermomicrobiales bacterium]